MLNFFVDKYCHINLTEYMENTVAPKISIIVPIYGVEKFIKECIESVLSQTFQEWELILVDDGSKDLCGQICDEYTLKDDRIRVLHKENEGLLKARIDGVNISKGEYVTFIDGDDYILSNRLENLWSLCMEYQVDMVSSSFKKKNVDGSFQIADYCGLDGYYDSSMMKSAFRQFVSMLCSTNTTFVHIWSKLVRRNRLIEVYGKIDNLVSYGEDVVTVLPLLDCVENMYVDNKDESYVYRIHDGSMGNTFNEDMFYRIERYAYCYLSVPLSKESNEIRKQYKDDFMYVTIVALIGFVCNLYSVSSYERVKRLYKEFTERESFKPFFVSLKNHPIDSKLGIVYWLLSRKKYRTSSLLVWLNDIRKK